MTWERQISECVPSLGVRSSALATAPTLCCPWATSGIRFVRRVVSLPRLVALLAFEQQVCACVCVSQGACDRCGKRLRAVRVQRGFKSQGPWRPCS